MIEIALDTPTYDDVKPFWAAVLGYETSKAHAEELNDPNGTRPTAVVPEGGLRQGRGPAALPP